MVKTRIEDPQISLLCSIPWNVILSPFSALTLNWVRGKASSMEKPGCWFVDGDDLTGALHVLFL